MKRRPEPELMLDDEQARAYAAADFSSAHSLYPKLFAATFPRRPRKALVLDLGCGPGDVTRRFAAANPGYQFHAVDGSAAMLKHAPRSPRIRLIHGTIPAVDLPATAYDVILASSLLHHLHDPGVLWNTVCRYAKPGTRVFVVDLCRPACRAAARQLVEKYAAQEPAVLKRDFYNSLCAAFTPAEVRAQLRMAGLTDLRVRQITDRHLMVSGVVTAPIRIRPARRADYPAMMRLINDVFFDGQPRFQKGWPHIYRPPSRAYRWGHLAFAGTQLVGHIGIYPIQLRTGRGLLQVAGIGAVATDQRYRQRGVMAALLRHAVSQMRRDGYDISILWGNRWRYGQYGWEAAGQRLTWQFDAQHADSPQTVIRPRPWNPRRDLGRLRALWNRDPLGTRPTAERFPYLLRRAGWQTLVLDDPSFAFVTYSVNKERSHVSVAKAGGSAPALRLLLLFLHQHVSRKVTVIGPATEHPLRQLALRDGGQWTIAEQGLVKIIHPRQLSQKLRLRLPNCRDERALVRMVFGSPLTGTGLVPWHFEPIAEV